MAGENDINKEGDGSKAGEELNTLKSTMEGMKGELDNLKQAKADLEKMRDESDKQLLSPEYLEFLDSKKTSPSHSDNKEKEDVNFEEMTPNQIAKHFTTAYKGDLDKALTSITKRMDGLDEGLGKAFASIDLAITSMKHTDLGEALETPVQKRNEEQKQLVITIHKVATDNPSWSSEKCYKQAKLQLKADAEEKSEEEKEKAEKENKLLSEKPGSSATILQGKSLKKEEAADIAWKHAFGNKTNVNNE